MATSIIIKQQFSVSASTLYPAWLNSDEHGKMTGGPAECNGVVGDEFSVWEGYITGKNVSLTPNSEIVQTWRSSDFKESDPDSELIVRFEDNENGCELTLIHNNIPDGQPDYEEGWRDHYFNPMLQYFN